MHRSFPKGCFTCPLGVRTAIFLELMGFIIIVELVDLKGWFPFCIETDSLSLVCKVKSNSQDVPWISGVRWRRCLNIQRNNNFIISHIFRERNGVVDKIANDGLRLSDFTWWYDVLDGAFDAYRRNLSLESQASK